MCLVINKKQCPNGYKIAKKNIPCYKVLLKRHLGSFDTPYQKQSVNTKTGMEADSFQTKPINRFRIDKGIHSYTNLEAAYITQNSLFVVINTYIYAGIVVLKAYIPKGTKYWVGEGHEFCSERIIFTEK